MDIYRVTFIGHREVEHYREIEDGLMRILPALLHSKEFIEFQIGRNGEFDIFAASCIKRVQKMYGKDNSAITLVLPYPVANIKYYEDYYDSVFIPQEVGKSHPKGAILKRNQWMINNSEMLIAYVRRNEGGAAKCLKMAQKSKIKIVRI